MHSYKQILALTTTAAAATPQGGQLLSTIAHTAVDLRSGAPAASVTITRASSSHFESQAIKYNVLKRFATEADFNTKVGLKL